MARRAPGREQHNGRHDPGSASKHPTSMHVSSDAATGRMVPPLRAGRPEKISRRCQRNRPLGRSSGEGEFVDEFDAEFESLWSRAYGVAYVVLGDRSESEDVAQETLARALVRWKKVSAYAEPWVVRVAGNLAIDRVRTRHRPRGIPAHDLPEARRATRRPPARVARALAEAT